MHKVQNKLLFIYVFTHVRAKRSNEPVLHAHNKKKLNSCKVAKAITVQAT